MNSLTDEKAAHFKRQASVNIRQLLLSRPGLIEHIKRACIQGGWVSSMEMRMNMSHDGKQLIKLSQLTTSHKHAAAERQHAYRANVPNQDLLVCHFADVRNLAKIDL